MTKGQRTLTKANALADPSPFLFPASHTLILTLCKRVAFCRSAPVLNASNPHLTLHSTFLPDSCNSSRTTWKLGIPPQSFIALFKLQRPTVSNTTLDV